MSGTISIDQMADAVMEGLNEYAALATDEMKAAVKKSAKAVRVKIKDKAPERSGQYAKSWRTKTTRENANTLSVTVYSHKRYMLTHLLEYGHAKRGGGRVEAIPHIAPAEAEGIALLEQEIERALR